MNSEQFSTQAKMLIGLYIDTNERKYEPVNRVNCHAVLQWLVETGKLRQLRRLAPQSKCFTAYTYHGGDLQETLQDYLTSEQ